MYNIQSLFNGMFVFASACANVVKGVSKFTLKRLVMSLRCFDSSFFVSEPRITPAPADRLKSLQGK